MNTNYHTGTNILFDDNNANRNCIAVKTSKNNHMVCAYTSTISTSATQLYGLVMTNNGILRSSFPLPDRTTNSQIDADLAPIDGTDSFVSVWSSNAEGSGYRIYMRSYTLSDSGELISEGIALQISQSNGNYFAPRVTYNQSTETVYVMWLSVAAKAIQYKAFKLNPDGTFSEISYEGNLADTFSPEYFPASTILDLRNNASLSIAFLNIGDRVLAVAKKNENTLGFYSLKLGTGGLIEQSHISDYAITKIRSFSVAYDNAKPAFNIVYTLNVSDSNSDILGDHIPYFPGMAAQNIRATPVTLNQGNQNCSRPSIKRTPAINSAGDRYFVVAWDTGNEGTFYNVFTSDYSQVNVETEINAGDDSTDYAHIVATDNQLLIIVNASRFNNEPLSKQGILYHVETHSSF